MNDKTKKLLEPISAEQPCGPDLSNDPNLDALAAIAKGKPEVEIGEVKKPAEPPEWRELLGRSAEFLGQSKHLQVAMMYCCSLLKTEGVEGLREGLQLIRGLLEQYWTDLYPRLDPEDNNDPIQRLNIPSALNTVGGPFSGWLTILDNLYAAEICRSKGMPPLTFRQLLDAKAKVPGAPDPAKLATAIREVGNDLIAAKRQALTDCLEAAQGIDQFLTTTLGATTTISFDELQNALRELLKELAPFSLDGGGGGETGPGGSAETGAGAGETGGGGMVVSGSIRSRDDVIAALDRICAYYAQVEPGSPVPFLLKRAQKMVRMNFVETMAELSLANVDALRPSMGSAVEPPPES
jgi:type VI secretion system protein ImpA